MQRLLVKIKTKGMLKPVEVIFFRMSEKKDYQVIHQLMFLENHLKKIRSLSKIDSTNWRRIPFLRR